MINKHRTRELLSPNHKQYNYILGISVRQTEKRGVIYILLAILFCVHVRENVAAILDFFFKIY